MFAYSLPESLIKGLSIRAKELGAINLGQGIPSFPTAAHIVSAAKTALDDPIIGVYPNFLGELPLRHAIASRLAEQERIELSESTILVTVGAMEGTAAAILAVVETGQRVGIITPDYCNHVPQVLLARGEIIQIPMLEGNEWALDLNLLEAEAKKGLKLLVLTNPNNPVGSICTGSELKRIVAMAKKYGFWLLADETYAFLTYDTTFVSLLSFWKEYDKLLVVRSFSKEYAMTGWRVGYIVTREAHIKTIAKVHDALTGCASKISQRAAIAAITGVQTIVDSYCKSYVKRRQLAMDILGKEQTRISCIPPRGAYYLFIKYHAKQKSIPLCEKLLTESGVAAIPGVAFGKGGEYHIRISFAVPEEILTQGLARMVKFFRTAI